MPFDQVACDGQLGGAFGGQAIFLALLGHGIIQLLIFGHADANLVAFSGGNPALAFQFAPGNIIFLWADQAEYISLASIFTHQRRGQAQAATGLNLRCDAEDGSGQQMNFVIDNQAPVVAGEEREMRESPLLPNGDRSSIW